MQTANKNNNVELILVFFDLFDVNTNPKKIIKIQESKASHPALDKLIIDEETPKITESKAYNLSYILFEKKILYKLTMTHIFTKAI